MSIKKTLSFAGEKITDSIYIALAFGDVSEDADGYKSLAWKVIFLGKGDTTGVPVVYSPQFAVAPVHLKDGNVKAGGVILHVKLGQSADLIGEGLEIKWDTPQDIKDKSKIMVYNKTDQAHDIALLLVDAVQSMESYGTVKVATSIAAGGMATLACSWILKAYAANKIVPGDIVTEFKQKIGWSRDLTKIAHTTCWTVKESRERVYFIEAA